MNKLTRKDLWSLEQYAEKRTEFRSQLMPHKKNRRISLGENAYFYFENQLTVRYQIQEMLRIEKIFEADGIKDELDAYNPLIPDGSNWKATFMLEFIDENERKRQLANLIGIERTVWVKAESFDPVFAIADEDLERETEEKTSSVHFLRFELSADMITALKQGAALSMGIDHNGYRQHARIDDPYRASLLNDLD
ncbi:MAG: DUF3501 family protein [Pseudomonadales bacterium]|nr:DUF3501 family protein [Pseudomonadales bacterium]